MGIFEQSDEKSDFDKLNVKVIQPYKFNDRWVFDCDNKTWDLAPAGMTEAALSPVIVGVDRLIAISAKTKDIKNPEAGFNLLFSNEYFPACDVKISFVESKFDGWLYDMEGVNTEVNDKQQVWICPYLKLYYEQPPKQLYLKIEDKNG